METKVCALEKKYENVKILEGRVKTRIVKRNDCGMCIK